MKLILYTVETVSFTSSANNEVLFPLLCIESALIQSENTLSVLHCSFYILLYPLKMSLFSSL